MRIQDMMANGTLEVAMENIDIEIAPTYGKGDRYTAAPNE